MGLLLEQNLISIVIRMYPSYKSKKSYIRKLTTELKEQKNTKGHIKQVAVKNSKSVITYITYIK